MRTAIPLTTLRSWRAGEARRSARPARRPLRRCWRGRRSPWRRPRCRCRCGRRRRGRPRSRSSANPRQNVPDPVHADALGGDPGQVPADAAPQVVIAAVGDRAPAGVPQQLPVGAGHAAPGRARPGGPSRSARPAASAPSRRAGGGLWPACRAPGPLAGHAEE